MKGTEICKWITVDLIGKLYSQISFFDKAIPVHRYKYAIS